MLSCSRSLPDATAYIGTLGGTHQVLVRLEDLGMMSTDICFTLLPSTVITTIAGAGACSVYTQSNVPRPSVAPMTGSPETLGINFLLSPVGPRRDLGSPVRSGNLFTPPPERESPDQCQDSGLREELSELKQLVTLLARLVTQN